MYNKKRKIPETKDINQNEVSIHQIHNRFDVFVKNIETGEEQQCYAENVVTNIAWQEIIFKREANVLRLGSSSTPEDPTQTNLLAPFNTGITASNTVYAYHGLNGNKRTSTFFLGLGTSNGNTITEVGLTNSTSYPYVLNRAMLKDLNGNPISINKTDLIEVTFYVTIYVTINLQPWQAVLSSSSLFSLINNGNQGFTASSLTGQANAFSSNYTYTAGKLTKKSVRIQPTQLNKGVSIINSFGIQHQLVRKNNHLYTLTDQPLATGDGIKDDFYCGYFMTEITLYRNGVVIPKSEYTFNPYADDKWVRGASPSEHRAVANIWMRDEKDLAVSSTNNPLDTSKIYVLPSDIEWVWIKMWQKFTTSHYRSWLYGSNNLIDWTELYYFNNQGTYDQPILYKYYKTNVQVSSFSFLNFYTKGGPQILFNTPPAVGDVLTFSGKTRCIPKDENHVMEMETYLTYTDPNL